MGTFSEDALKKYSELCAQKQGVDFSEGETYDFTRCVKPDGEAYGTRGNCKVGKPEDKKLAQLRDQKPHKPPAGWKPYGGGDEDKGDVKIPLEGVMQGGWLKKA
jgi:hypothetical protein